MSYTATYRIPNTTALKFCVCMCGEWYVQVCIYVSMWRSEVSLGCLLLDTGHCLLRLGFSLAWSSESGLGLLAREPLGSTYLYLPSSRTTMINHHEWLFKQKLMIRLRSSFLQGKKSDSWRGILSCLPNLLSLFNSLC